MQYTLLFALFVAVCSALPAYVKRDPTYSIQLNSETAFCSFLPPNAGDDVGATEDNGIPFCTNSSLGGQVFPDGFIKTAHYVNTDSYVQVTGTMDGSKYSLSNTDGGGQYDNKDVAGVSCNGYKYWVNMLEPDTNLFCIRCCQDQSDCNLGASTYGCERVVPGDYS
ncbi:hypothetical protein EDC96DRAFT_499906 [Choanephora cucurbitarum]|nr:hypothetical protein EDC96DRAFT_499906 [Choanephora cucurbitarum]